MLHFQILYPNNTTAIVLPCVAREHDQILNLLGLIQSRDIADPYALDLMAKLAAMLPRLDVRERGFKLYAYEKKKKIFLSQDTLKEIFYGDDNEPALLIKIHRQRERTQKKSDKLPLKLSDNMSANLLAQLISLSRQTGCNTTDLMHQYSLRLLDDMVHDFSELVRPYEDREEEEIQRMWVENHAERINSPEFLFGLNLMNNS